MKKEFWLEKWQKNQTGFHKNFVHPLLKEYLSLLKLSKGDTVFVPLCGKSLDILWLNNQGYNVIGVEFSELAVKQFFDDNNLSFVKSQEERFMVYSYENIKIYQGDFFDLTQAQLKGVKAVYDRAALIALPNDLAMNYVTAMKKMLPDNTLELLITLEFEKKTGPAGPPFNTPDEKIQHLFENYSSVNLEQKKDIISREPKFEAQGCDFVYERIYFIKF